MSLNQLKRRGDCRVDVICVKEEIADRILHCSKAGMLWWLVFALFGVQWVMSSSIKDVLLSWHRSFVGKKKKKPRRATPLCLFRTLWKERNRKAFENTKKVDQTIKRSFRYMFLE